jgi:hypothetical protein
MISLCSGRVSLEEVDIAVKPSESGLVYSLSQNKQDIETRLHSWGSSKEVTLLKLTLNGPLHFADM